MLSRIFPSSEGQRAEISPVMQRPPIDNALMGSLAYPVLVVRVFSAVYQRERIQLRAGSPSLQLESGKCVLQHPWPVDSHGQVTAECRSFLLERVRSAVRTRRMRMCVIWSRESCTYVEAERMFDSHDLPSGGEGGFKLTSLTSSDCVSQAEFPLGERATNSLTPIGSASSLHPFDVHLELSSGRIVGVHELHLARTYACLLGGTPDSKYNELIIERARCRMMPVWGERPTYVVPPMVRIITEAGRTYPRLPEVQYHVWLESEPLSEHWCGSQLVVICFGPPQHQAPVAEILGPLLRDVPWEQVAQNFDF